MDHTRLHARARTKGVNPIVYWLMRAWLQPFAHIYWRLSRIGREHVPQDGPVIFVSNHRSFIDPFIVGLCSRRPVYYVAKEELFHNRLLGWFISSLGAFPVRRGAADGGHDRDGQGDPRARRPGPDLPRGHPHPPRRARQAQARRRPARAGDRRDRRPGRDDRHRGDPQGLPRPPAQDPRADRRAAELPEGRDGHRPARRRGHRPHLAERDAPVGVARRPAAAAPRGRHRRRQLGHRGRGHARPRRHRGRPRLPHQGAGRPDGRHAREPAATCPASSCPAASARSAPPSSSSAATTSSPSPSPRPSCRRSIAAHAPKLAPRTGVLVLSKGLVPPLGTLPSAYVAERTHAWAVGVLGGPAHAAEALDGGASLVLATKDPSLHPPGQRRPARRRPARHARPPT